jgi:hypothetical protein
MSEKSVSSHGDRAQLLPSGVQLVFKNRAGRAHDRLNARVYGGKTSRIPSRERTP